MRKIRSCLRSPPKSSMACDSAISWSSGTDLRFSSAMFTDDGAALSGAARAGGEGGGSKVSATSRGVKMRRSEGRVTERVLLHVCYQRVQCRVVAMDVVNDC